MSGHYQLLPTNAHGQFPEARESSFVSRLLPLRLPWKTATSYQSRAQVPLRREWTRKRLAIYVAFAALGLVFLLYLVDPWNSLFVILGIGGPLSACHAKPQSARSYFQWPFPSSEPLEDEEKYPQQMYHCIVQPVTSPTPALRPYQILPEQCRDEYFEKGALCAVAGTSKFDLAWTWVNGSEALLSTAMAAAENSNGHEAGVGSKGGQKLYRDHDELRHSLRSALQHFRPHAQKFHLITSDFPIPPETEPSPLRLGMIPQWLDQASVGTWSDGNVQLNIVHHSQLYPNYQGTPFNSFSIESQLYNLPSGDNLIYLNDDFFFLRDLQAADFHTSSFGLVFRLLAWPWLLISPQEVSTKPANGEWRPLEYTSFLLSKRFGFRNRPYSTHVAKVASIPLMQELVQVWPEEFDLTASHKFRGEHGDVYMMFGFVHYVIERHREALLWSYFVAKMGGDNDEWGAEQNRRVWAELGAVDDEPHGNLTVHVTKRDTLEPSRLADIFAATGDSLGGTEYRFSSQDGYPYSFVGNGLPWDDDLSWWPTLHENKNFPTNSSQAPQWATCTIDYDVCFSRFDRASDIFANVAFENPLCGDCIIKALVSSSGSLGLGAFLPPKEKTFGSGNSQTRNSPPPHLPLEKEWQNIDFSLDSVLKSHWSYKVNVRTWVERLLERYRFVIGDSHFVFAMIYNPRDANKQLGKIDSREDMALCAINDDVNEDFQETDRVMREWFEKRWSTPAKWES